mmetsp:Transcript_24320/g.37592  ORF Transcript_24320/g.37592 Transcript_24320/m.37592 type:complete len:377 (-) Transcript_24320:1159-2289(-)
MREGQQGVAHASLVVAQGLGLGHLVFGSLNLSSRNHRLQSLVFHLAVSMNGRAVRLDILSELRNVNLLQVGHLLLQALVSKELRVTLVIKVTKLGMSINVLGVEQHVVSGVLLLLLEFIDGDLSLNNISHKSSLLMIELIEGSVHVLSVLVDLLLDDLEHLIRIQTGDLRDFLDVSLSEFIQGKGELPLGIILSGLTLSKGSIAEVPLREVVDLLSHVHVQLILRRDRLRLLNALELLVQTQVSINRMIITLVNTLEDIGQVFLLLGEVVGLVEHSLSLPVVIEGFLDSLFDELLSLLENIKKEIVRIGKLSHRHSLKAVKRVSDGLASSNGFLALEELEELLLSAVKSLLVLQQIRESPLDLLLVLLHGLLGHAS